MPEKDEETRVLKLYKFNNLRYPISNIKNLVFFSYKSSWSVLSGIYSSKTYTKYAVYSLILFLTSKNKYMGAVSFNCNAAAFILFNYIRTGFPQLFNDYKNDILHKYEISSNSFNCCDFLFHTTPFLLSIYYLPSWYYEINNKMLMSISSATFVYELMWAYYYASGLDVSKVYDIEKSDKKLTGKDCRRVWLIILFCHFFISGFKISNKLMLHYVNSGYTGSS